MPPEDTALERILNQAIRFEEDAYQFYTRAMPMVTSGSTAGSKGAPSFLGS